MSPRILFFATFSGGETRSEDSGSGTSGPSMGSGVEDDEKRGIDWSMIEELGEGTMGGSEGAVGPLSINVLVV